MLLLFIAVTSLASNGRKKSAGYELPRIEFNFSFLSSTRQVKTSEPSAFFPRRMYVQRHAAKGVLSSFTNIAIKSCAKVMLEDDIFHISALNLLYSLSSFILFSAIAFSAIIESKSCFISEMDSYMGFSG